ncbi:hypothetical protein BaRGS_00006410 [Batillaria attramentaria]|uniref:H15 domain-containing protein n=1 Tax=Batillaria attramentaria TaxID=370345 RepID=A0ABD0LSN2_9CAEN
MRSRNQENVSRKSFVRDENGIPQAPPPFRLNIQHITSAIAHLGEIVGSSPVSIKAYLTRQFPNWTPSIFEVKHMLNKAVTAGRVDEKDNKFKINMAYYSPQQIRARILARRKQMQKRGRRRRRRRGRGRRRRRRRHGRKPRRIYRKSRFAKRHRKRRRR